VEAASAHGTTEHAVTMIAAHDIRGMSNWQSTGGNNEIAVYGAKEYGSGSMK